MIKCLIFFVKAKKREDRKEICEFLVRNDLIWDINKVIAMASDASPLLLENVEKRIEKCRETICEPETTKKDVIIKI